MKYMNTEKKYLPMNLQFFAEGGADGADAGEGDDQDDDTSDKDGEEEKEKKFSQKDIDSAIEKRIARERRKWQREQEKSPEKKKDSDNDKDGNEETQKRIAAETRAETLEMKWTCMEHDVDKKCVDDVAALAHSYMTKDNKLDFEDAIDKVLVKYPHFKTTSGSNKDDEEEKPNTKKSWGERQKSASKKLTGVEAAFLKSNPELKTD